MSNHIPFVSSMVFARDSNGIVNVLISNTDGTTEVLEVGKDCIGFDDIETGLNRIRRAAEALAKAKEPYGYRRPPRLKFGEPQPAFQPPTT